MIFFTHDQMKCSPKSQDRALYESLSKQAWSACLWKYLETGLVSLAHWIWYFDIWFGFLWDAVLRVNITIHFWFSRQCVNSLHTSSLFENLCWLKVLCKPFITDCKAMQVGATRGNGYNTLVLLQLWHCVHIEKTYPGVFKRLLMGRVSLFQCLANLWNATEEGAVSVDQSLFESQNPTLSLDWFAKTKNTTHKDCPYSVTSWNIWKCK